MRPRGLGATSNYPLGLFMSWNCNKMRFASQHFLLYRVQVKALKKNDNSAACCYFHDANG